ncbi:hypothetical protein [Thiothrix lacustris]|uniref:hypothetical protein n=1 Tax=Thiothrix lacustris TaxID=525917 RepID=UPI0027E48493|nr:hypothetical protein [Thiothrix lacustris]WMP15843.1 hypothetical protein RCS87_10590 [Thiothrix lacustris]
MHNNIARIDSILALASEVSMFVKGREHEWIIVENKPTTFGGYTQQTKTTTSFFDGRSPEVNEFSYEIAKQQHDGTIYAYRLTHFRFPKLRGNGVSPLSLIDIATYDYESKKLKSFSSGLVNIINSDSLMTGIVVLAGANCGFGFGYGNIPLPPKNWNDFKTWHSNLSSRNLLEISKTLKQVHSSFDIVGLPYKTTVREIKAPWDMVQNYLLESAYLTEIEIRNGEKTCTFRGTVSGNSETRSKMVKSFLGSVAIAIDLD